MATEYHRLRGFPESTRPPEKWLLELSDHASDYKENGRKYVDGIDLPVGILFKGVEDVYAVYEGDDGVDLLDGHMFELVEYAPQQGGDRDVSRVGLRFDYDDEHDLVIITDPLESPPPESTVYSPYDDETPTGTIISCWLNKKDDDGEGRDLSRYATVKEEEAE